MPSETRSSEDAEYCAICGQVAILSWTDLDLEARICDDCAESLIERLRRNSTIARPVKLPPSGVE